VYNASETFLRDAFNNSNEKELQEANFFLVNMIIKEVRAQNYSIAAKEPVSIFTNYKMIIDNKYNHIHFQSLNLRI
jgi:hypothetical protein